MPRSFNTTEPCDPQRHSLLPPVRTLPNLDRFFVEDLYFVLHAPRQTGKTMVMRALAQRLRERGLVAVWATLEGSQGVTETAEPIRRKGQRWDKRLWRKEVEGRKILLRGA